MISLEKWMILIPLQKLPGDLGKIIVATGFECLPKKQTLNNLVTLFGTYKEAIQMGGTP